MKAWITGLVLCITTSVAAQVSVWQPVELKGASDATHTRMALYSRLSAYHTIVQDTTSVPTVSIMFRGRRYPVTVNSKNFRCGPYWIPDPPPIFQVAAGSTLLGDMVGDILCETINVLLF